MADDDADTEHDLPSSDAVTVHERPGAPPARPSRMPMPGLGRYDLGEILGLGRLDHERARDGERHRGGMEAVVDEALGDIVDGHARGIPQRPQVEASEFVKDYIKPKVETIPGVAGIEIFGKRDRQIRIWLDGEAMRARGLAATDVIAALRREHVERPGGLVEGSRIEFAVKTQGEYATLAELAAMVVAFEDGAPVRLSDVARLEDGAEDERGYARYSGAPAVGRSG